MTTLFDNIKHSIEEYEDIIGTDESIVIDRYSHLCTNAYGGMVYQARYKTSWDSSKDCFIINEDNEWATIGIEETDYLVENWLSKRPLYQAEKEKTLCTQ
jgi:hypothetical protein